MRRGHPGDARASGVAGGRRRAIVAITLAACAAGGAFSVTSTATAATATTATAATARADVQVVETTSDLLEHLTPQPSLTFSSRSPAGIPLIHVDDAVRYQRITGVGGAMTDTAAWLIHNRLSSPARAILMRALFGAEGIHISFVRVPIAASDFTVRRAPYTYDDMPAGQTDPGLANFSISHDLGYQIPALRQMVHINPGVQIIADPWTAPAWMKANQAPDNQNHLGTLLPSASGPLAQYFVQFLKAYASQGIQIAAITPQNEPHAATNYPGMELTEPDEATWIAEDLAPALAAAGLHPKIYGGDLGWGLPSYSDALATSEAQGALAGIAWHCYGPDPTVLSTLHALAPSLDQIVSECAPGIIPYPVAEVLIGSIRQWASAVSLWNLALDRRGGPVQLPNLGCFGCTGLVTINERTHAVGFTLAYYQLGQVSKYVEPGAVRVDSNSFVSFITPARGNDGVAPGLDDVAFLNPDGTRVLVAYNNSAVAIRFAVRWRGRAFRYTIPPTAMTTFEWR